jgi:ribosome biogenesis GTPase
VDYFGQYLLCDLRGNLKDKDDRYVNPVAVGDWVLVKQDGNHRGIVEAVYPRKSVLTRPYSPDEGKVVEDLFQIVAANVDRLLVVASWREPYIWPALIDRYLISARRNQIEAVICINKIDLVDDWQEIRNLVEVYQNLGYPLILSSVVTKEGLEELERLLGDSTTVLGGLSGVGKSSLLNTIQPDLDLKIGGVSESGLFTGQGRHTTTQSSLWQLENNGIVIDTPGVRSFGLAGLPPSSLAGFYPEMDRYIQDCRFSNCSHIIEPGCAIKNAVDKGQISKLRYKNYTQLHEELSRLS